MSLPVLTAWLGLQRDYQALQINNNDGTPATNVYTSGTTLQAQIWVGGTQPVSAIWQPIWYTANGTQTGYDQGQFSLSILPSYITGLDQAGEYHVIVTASTNGINSPAWEGLLQVKATPGFGGPNPPDLVTYDYCLEQLSDIVLSATQIDRLPGMISEASSAIRFWCNRTFTQQIYVETCDVELDGFIRLTEIPINSISRIQSNAQTAITISNNGASEAWVVFATTGDSTGPTGIAVTGLILNSYVSGVLSSPTVAFTQNMTISQLSSLIGAVGGWTAFADSVLGLYNVSELLPQDALIGKGATPNDQPDGGAGLRVYTSNVTNAQPHAQDGMKTGLIWVGRQFQDLGPRWGDGWEGQDGSGGREPGFVKVTYNGGYATIPYEVQLATVELVKADYERLATDLILESERAGQYQYKINPEMVDMLPRNVRQGLSRYKVWDA